MIKIVIPIQATESNIQKVQNFINSSEFQLELLSRFYNRDNQTYEYRQDTAYVGIEE